MYYTYRLCISFPIYIMYTPLYVSISHSLYIGKERDRDTHIERIQLLLRSEHSPSPLQKPLINAVYGNDGWNPYMSQKYIPWAPCISFEY